MMRGKTLIALCALALAAPLAAQDQPAGISLRGPYNVNRPLLAVRPFTGPAPIAEAVDSLTQIVQRDVTYNKRFRVLEVVPQNLQSGEVDYRAWNGLNVVYLVAAEVTPGASGYELSIVVHDVVYARPLNQQRYTIPSVSDPDFRMAVHAVSDEVVRWVTQAPGIAATQIAFTRQNGNGSYDLMLMDSDGFNLRRIAGFGGQLYSPTWSPDGRRILYTVNTGSGWQLIERDVTSGSQRTISPGGEMLFTPTYTRDGRGVALGVWRGDGSEVARYDLARQCCLEKLSGSGTNLEMYPSFAPDGRRLAFMSNRLGRPGIYVMPAEGGTATLITPFVRGQPSEYYGASWSPIASRIAFHGHWSRGNFQIMIADADRPGAQIEQITGRGNNEDPSWGPDGRHLVYTSVGDGPSGLYAIDAETKERRLLIPGANMRMAEWSPRLVNASELIARSGNSNEEKR